jgi:anti-sigma factor RsiW
VDHEEAKELIDAYAIGALDPEEVRLVEEHLEGCEECRQELVEAREAAALVALGSPLRLPSLQLRSRVVVV